MLNVKIENEIKNIEEGLTYFELSQIINHKKGEPFLVKASGSVKELGDKVNDLEEIEFLYYDNNIVKLAYESTAIFILYKVYNDCFPSDSDIFLKFKIDNGLYFEKEDKTEISEEQIKKIKERFSKVVNDKIIIKKVLKERKNAFDIFDNKKMANEKLLFKYSSNDNIFLRYIDDYVRYISGKTLYDTGYIKYYDIEKYNNGMLLLLPDTDDVTKIGKCTIPTKLFKVQNYSKDWSRLLNIDVIGKLNQKISINEFDNLVILSESLQDKFIGDIAQNIFNLKKKVIFIAGPSSSGKTTFSHRLSYCLKAFGFNSYPIACDNFFKSRKETPLDEDGNLDFDTIGALDVDLVKDTLCKLLNGLEVEIPKFNFYIGERERGQKLALKENDLIIFEGIHCLNPILSEGILKDNIYKIYISALTPIFIDSVNRISTSDLRLIRRITRDNRDRGINVKDTIKRWASVRKGEEKSIFPFQDNADVLFNSAFPYEFNILKTYSLPLLYNVVDDKEVGDEARRLIKLLNYFLSVNTEAIPNYSIIREFIGGSILDV